MNSNTNLKKYLNKRKITGVVFDIDNTLLATSDYYRKQVKQLSLKLSHQLNRDSNETVKGINESIKKVFFKNNRKPTLIHKIYLAGLKIFLKKDVPHDLKKQITEFFSDFYTVVPTPYKATEDILRSFIDTNVNIILHSHAQEDWTKVKTDYLSNLVNHELKYFATPITEDKNKDSWLKAFKLINSKPGNTLVIGDNFYADILPSIKAGSKYLIWIDRYAEGLDDKELSDDIELLVIEDIGEILDNFKS